MISSVQATAVLQAIFVTALSNAVSSLLGRQVNRLAYHSPLIITFISMGVGSLVLLSTGVIFQGIGKLDWQNWLLIVWLAFVNTAFAFTRWNHTLRTLSAVESSIINAGGQALPYPGREC